MFEEAKVAPSILSADFMDLNGAVQLMKDAGADWVHVDVMDGHFVPNLSMGIPVVKCMKAACDLPIDVHLMIDNPLVQIPWYVDAGADVLTVHVEALDADELAEAVAMIKDAGVKAAVAIKPKTDAAAIESVISDVDMVLVMSVEPGFSGQSYIDGTDDKVREVVQMAQAHGASPLIQVDGGISSKTCSAVLNAGADVLVCGNAFFCADDPQEEVAILKELSAFATKGRA